MTFKLTTSGNFYSKKDARKLETLGFRFESYKEFKDSDQYKIEPRASSITLNTLEDLIKFSKRWGTLLFYPDRIEIYDDYRE